MDHIFEMGFQLTGILCMLIFVLLFVIFVVILIQNLKQWRINEKSPRLTVDATVVSKRTHVSRRRIGNHANISHSTSYYATFQVDSGDRMELRLPGREYGLIVEGDKGKVTFQGTRFLEFERT